MILIRDLIAKKKDAIANRLAETGCIQNIWEIARLLRQQKDVKILQLLWDKLL